MRLAATMLVATLAPSLAAADPPDPILYHVSGGVEIESDGNITSVAFRAHGLIGHAFGDGAVRPELAAGGTLGLGGLFVPDPRAVSGDLSLSNYTYGPEAQIALQLYDGSAPTTRIFASAAYLYDTLDPRLAMDPVPGVGGDRGHRYSVGVNFAHTLVHNEDCANNNHCELILAILLPQQIEISVEDEAGSQRWGATLSWGI
jgi:hypothetical protein